MFRNRDDQNLVLVSSLADSVTDTSITKVLRLDAHLAQGILLQVKYYHQSSNGGGGEGLALERLNPPTPWEY